MGSIEGGGGGMGRNNYDLDWILNVLCVEYWYWRTNSTQMSPLEELEVSRIKPSWSSCFDNSGDDSRNCHSRTSQRLWRRCTGKVSFNSKLSWRMNKIFALWSGIPKSLLAKYRVASAVGPRSNKHAKFGKWPNSFWPGKTPQSFDSWKCSCDDVPHN